MVVAQKADESESKKVKKPLIFEAKMKLEDIQVYIYFYMKIIKE